MAAKGGHKLAVPSLHWEVMDKTSDGPANVCTVNTSKISVSPILRMLVLYRVKKAKTFRTARFLSQKLYRKSASIFKFATNALKSKAK